MPPRPPHVPPVELPSADIARIRELYLDGKYRAAYEHGLRYGPLRGWAGPAGRLIAGRLAMQLGAPGLGRQLHALAYRESPAYPEAAYYFARYRLDRFGPLGCWQFAKQHADWSEAAPEIRGDWQALLAFVCARFRDFDLADFHLAQSEAAAPNRPWHYVERASVLEIQDKLDEALASAEQAHALHPWYRPAVQAMSHLLVRRGSEAAAIALLTEASDRLESGLVLAQLFGLQMESKQFADARRSLERFAELSPLAEAEVHDWIASRRADVAYFLGEPVVAIECARQIAGEGAERSFYAAFADRLEANPAASTSSRRTLDFERTQPGTAPPAAFETIERFWKATGPAAMIEPEPMVDGLPNSTDRTRFEVAGWTAREFTFNFATAIALIDRGVPFLATLFELGFGQHRLVVGYDQLRESIFVVEPGERRPAEASVAMVADRFASTGPRCLVLLPPAEVERIAGIDFPDGDRHDALYRLQRWLVVRDFASARGELDRSFALHPDHPLTLRAKLAWTKACAHPTLQLAAVEALHAAHPRELCYIMAKANLLRDLGRQVERTAFLAAAAGEPNADAILLQSYAQAVLQDPDRDATVDRLLRRSIRLRPHAPAGYYLLGAFRWERADFDTAVELHRMAACLDEREEQFAEAYVRVGRASGRISEAMKLLQRRVSRAELPWPGAVRSHYQALKDRGEPEFAWSTLDRNLEKLAPKPDEPPSPAYLELARFRAEALAYEGKFAEAEAAIESIRAGNESIEWHKSAARIARAKPEYRRSLDGVRAVLDRDPLNEEALRLHFGLLAEIEGKAAVRSALNQLAFRYPDYYPLLRLRAEFLSTEAEPDVAIRAVLQLLDIDRRDAWSHRQLALLYTEQRRFAEAFAAIEAAVANEPNNVSNHAIRGNALRRADRSDEALRAFKDGLELNIDHELSIAELVRTARGGKEKKAALRWVYEQLRVQPTTGEGLTAFRDQFLPQMDDPEEQEWLYGALDAMLEDRPDLWATWSLVIQQLLIMQRGEEAHSLALQATQRFPLISRLWLDLAEARRATNRGDERSEALRRAVEASPGWTHVAREYAEALAEQDDYDEAIAVLEANAQRAPMDPMAHGFLAERLWNSDRAEEAFERIVRAVKLEPGYDWGWQSVAVWGERLDKPNAAIDLARSLAADRSGDARVHMKLARSLYRFEQTEEALRALDRAIAIEPGNPEAHDLKAERLAEVGRSEEALAAASPPNLAEDMPLILRGRAAWVEAKRGQYGRAIPMMQALVSVDPGYYWGWSQLAEWYSETGKTEAYREAANEMLKLRPDHPTPLTMRGEAKLELGERDEAKADLREVLRQHPGYSPAAAILFDACLADGELREARAALSVLQEHMTGPEVVVKQILYALKTGDEDAALRAFRDVCTAEGEHSPNAVQLSLIELRRAGLGERANEVMEDSWSSGEPFHPWAALFWLDSQSEDEDDDEDGDGGAKRFAAIDAVLKQDPHFVPAHDRRAEQLARAERYDEAIAACTPPGVEPVPITLRGRAAWVEAQRGNRERAIALMAECLKADPDYTWGWRQIAHWYDDLDRTDEYLAATEQLVRLAPADPYSYGLRGEAKRQLGDHRGARDDYQRAYQLDPQFEAAGHQLLTEQIATDDLVGAEKTLESMRDIAGGPVLRLRAVQLAAKQNDLASARLGLRALCSDSEAERSTIRDAAEALDARQWGSEADAELDGALGDDSVTPAAAAVWVQRSVAAGRGWKAADRLKELAEAKPDVGRSAILSYAWALAVTGEPERAAATVQRFAELLRTDTESWARAGETLAEAKRYALASAWLADWKDRDGVEPWMLRSLADAHRASGDIAKSWEILNAAGELAAETDEDLPDDIDLWLGLEAAFEGDRDTALEIADDYTGVQLSTSAMVLAVLLRAVVNTERAVEKSKAFSAARETIRAALAACPKADWPPGLGRIYPRIAATIAKNVGTLSAKLWAIWQRFRPLVPFA